MNTKSKISDSDSTRSLAMLILSTHRKNRSHDLITISKLINKLLQRNFSLSELAKNLSITTKMLKLFTLANGLNPEIHSLIKERKIDSVDAISQLNQLKFEDQKVVAKELADHNLSTKDVRDIVQLRKQITNGSIESLISKVKGVRPSKRFILEFIVRDGVTSERLTNRLKKILKDESITIKIEGPFGKLILDNAGIMQLRKYANARNLILKAIIPTLIAEGI